MQQTCRRHSVTSAMSSQIWGLGKVGVSQKKMHWKTFPTWEGIAQGIVYLLLDPAALGLTPNGSKTNFWGYFWYCRGQSTGAAAKKRGKLRLNDVGQTHLVAARGEQGLQKHLLHYQKNPRFVFFLSDRIFILWENQNSSQAWILTVTFLSVQADMVKVSGYISF